MSRPELEIQNLTRHCNEALVLACLRDGPRHGYQLALDLEERSGGAFRFNHGTLYPILHRLEKDGIIDGTWSDDGPRRKRKSYALTERGRRYAAAQLRAWHDFLARFLDVTGAVREWATADGAGAETETATGAGE